MSAAPTSDFTPKFPVETRLFINGELVEATSGQSLKITNPMTKKLAAEVGIASKEDVDRAVVAAQAAQPAWAALTGKERGKCLIALGEKIAANKEQLNELEAIAIGKPVFASQLEAGWAADYCGTLAGLAESIYGDSSLNQQGFLNLTIKQPYGVVAAITAWNLGAPMWIWKVGPAVAAGNCIIIKTSEKSPLLSIALGKLAHEAGFPPGVIQVVSGAGSVGEFLSSHPKIRKISFTGSALAGRRVQAAAAASNLKAVTLELGGKSPSLVFGDCDLESTVQAVVMSSLILTGQVCSANTRVYVQEDFAPLFLEHLKGNFAGWTARQGNPHDQNTLIGPVADESQSKIIQKYLDIGKAEGTAVVGGGNDENGYVQPTIFTGLKDSSRLNTEEIFGPVLVYHTFKTEEEAIQRANDTEYGLYSSVFTKDIDRAIRVAKQLESGMVGINTASPTLHYDVPFGGWKSSGYGSEMGKNWIENWMQDKTIYIKVASA